MDEGHTEAELSQVATDSFESEWRVRPFTGGHVWLAVLYALFILVFSQDFGLISLAIVPIACLVSATIFMMAVWSALGPGSYLKRLLVAHLIGAVPVVGLCGPMFFKAAYGLGGFEYGTLVPLLLMVLPASLGAQLPFWFLRTVRGWQLVPRGQLAEAAFNLKDIFVGTLLIGACLAIAQWSISFASQSIPERLGSILAPEFDSNGQPTDEYKIVGAMENQAELRAQYSKNTRKLLVNSNLIAIGVACFVASVFAPVLPRMFHNKDQPGCGSFGLYLVVLAAVQVVIVNVLVAISGGFDLSMLFGSMFSSLVVHFVFALAVWAPLLTLRYQGIQLFTFKQPLVSKDLQKKPPSNARWL